MAQNFLLNEPIIEALQNQINNQIQSAVDTVNASVTDGYTIQVPAKVHKHVPLLTVLTATGFPAIGIEDGPTRFEDDLAGAGGTTGVHQLALIPFVANPDPEGLVLQLRRYQQAVMLVLQADRSLGGVVWTTRLLGNEPGPILSPSSPEEPDGTYVSWSAIHIECPRAEV